MSLENVAVLSFPVDCKDFWEKWVCFLAICLLRYTVFPHALCWNFTAVQKKDILKGELTWKLRIIIARLDMHTHKLTFHWTFIPLSWTVFSSACQHISLAAKLLFLSTHKQHTWKRVLTPKLIWTHTHSLKMEEIGEAQISSQLDGNHNPQFI